MLLVGFAVLLPAAAGAVEWLPIVQCGTGSTPCTPCDLFATFKRLIDFVLYGVTGPVAAFMIVVAGGTMLLSRGDPGMFNNGKAMLTNTLYGIAIILLSWMITNFVIKSLAKGNEFDTWYEFSCPAFLQSSGSSEMKAAPAVAPARRGNEPAPELVAALKAACDGENLSKEYNTPAGATAESPMLQQVITCILADPIVTALSVPRKDLYTYERDNPECNLTRGMRVCGMCAHAENSCHYGGKTGTLGAQAVDFNWNGKTVNYVTATRRVFTGAIIEQPECTVAVNGEARLKPGACRTATGEQGLLTEIHRTIINRNCSVKMLNFERDHTHVSSADCDTDVKMFPGLISPPMP